MHPGLVYDSNATILADTVRELGGEPVSFGIVRDDEAAAPGQPREDRARVAAASEGPVDVGAVGRRHERVDGLADPAAALKALDSAAQELLAAKGSLDAPWSSEMRLIWGGRNMPASGASGNYGDINVVDYGPPKDGVRR